MGCPKYSEGSTWPPAIAAALDEFRERKELARLAANDLMAEDEARVRAEAVEGVYGYAELRLRDASPQAVLNEIVGLKEQCQSLSHLSARFSAEAYADVETRLITLLAPEQALDSNIKSFRERVKVFLPRVWPRRGKASDAGKDWYALTDHAGVRKAEFPKEMAEALTGQLLVGEHKPETEDMLAVFEVGEDTSATMTSSDGHRYRLYFRKGDFIVRSSEAFVKKRSAGAAPA